MKKKRTMIGRKACDDVNNNSELHFLGLLSIVTLVSCSSTCMTVVGGDLEAKSPPRFHSPLSPRSLPPPPFGVKSDIPEHQPNESNEYSCPSVFDHRFLRSLGCAPSTHLASRTRCQGRHLDPARNVRRSRQRGRRSRERRHLCHLGRWGVTGAGLGKPEQQGGDRLTRRPAAAAATLAVRAAQRPVNDRRALCTQPRPNQR